MRRFFIPAANISGNNAFINGSDVHHVVNVLRKNTGDIIDVTDGLGNEIKAKITGIEETQINLEILASHPFEERKIFIRLFQAIPKGGKFDWIVEKACELGVSEIIPVITERTIPKLSEERGLKKISRWEKIAMETMKQVGRTSAMSIRPAIHFRDVQKHLKPFSMKIVFWELENETTLKAFLQKNLDREIKELEMIIGPEGGFSIAEVQELKSYGFNTLSLGKRILKAETASIAAISNIYYELEG